MNNVLLVGFPNSGKSTIFNQITNRNQKISNYSGITIDLAKGEFSSNKESTQKLNLIDLPGIYSLIPQTRDEAVTLGALVGSEPGVEEFQQIVAVVDVERFETSLALVLQLKEVFGTNILVVINKSDQARELSKDFATKLSEKIGLKVFTYSCINKNSKELERFLRDHTNDASLFLNNHIPVNENVANLNPLLVGNRALNFQNNSTKELEYIESFHLKAREIAAQLFAENKYVARTLKIDKLVLNPYVGGLIFLAIFYFIFHAIYTWSAPAMELMEQGVSTLGDYVGSFIPQGLFHSLIVDGVFAGVGGVVVFLPQICILFFFLSLLEQSGYISRAAYLVDRLMSRFGLNGKAFLPYLSGFACAVPAIMATRTIEDRKERMATLLTIPMITCSARLPVYILLIGTFIPSYKVLGIFNSQALAFFFLYFLGSFGALVMAKIFRLSMFRGQSGSFIMDFPHYQVPSLKFAIKTALLKGKIFLKKAGTIILGLSILVWILSTFPQADPTKLENLSENQTAAYQLEHSFIGTLGKGIEPLIKPLGFDWKMGIGLLVSFGARELFVSTMGTIYALGEVNEESSSLREKLASESNAKTGVKLYSYATVWSLLIFFVFALQCLSTLAIIKKETNSWKYALFSLTYLGLLGYFGSFVTYNLLR